jgi:hypothetical protein
MKFRFAGPLVWSLILRGRARLNSSSASGNSFLYVFKWATPFYLGHLAFAKISGKKNDEFYKPIKHDVNSLCNQLFMMSRKDKKTNIRRIRMKILTNKTAHLVKIGDCLSSSSAQIDSLYTTENS